MPKYLITYRNGSTDVVDADEIRYTSNALEAVRAVLVMNRPRSVVALRRPLSDVSAVVPLICPPHGAAAGVDAVLAHRWAQGEPEWASSLLLCAEGSACPARTELIDVVEALRRELSAALMLEDARG